jgi:hypothetical protein
MKQTNQMLCIIISFFIISLLLIRKWFREFVYAYVIIIIISLLVHSCARVMTDSLNEWNEMNRIESNWIELIDWLRPTLPSPIHEELCIEWRMQSVLTKLQFSPIL